MASFPAQAMCPPPTPSVCLGSSIPAGDSETCQEQAGEMSKWGAAGKATGTSLLLNLVPMSPAQF